MPIIRSHADIQALGALSFMTGQSLGKSEKSIRDEARADADLRSLIGLQQSREQGMAQLQGQRIAAQTAREGYDARRDIADQEAERRLYEQEMANQNRLALGQQTTDRTLAQEQVRGEYDLQEQSLRQTGADRRVEDEQQFKVGFDQLQYDRERRDEGIEDDKVYNALREMSRDDSGNIDLEKWARLQAQYQQRKVLGGSFTGLDRSANPEPEDRVEQDISTALTAAAMMGNFNLINGHVGQPPEQGQYDRAGQALYEKRKLEATNAGIDAFSQMSPTDLQSLLASPNNGIPPYLIPYAENQNRANQNRPSPSGHRPANSAAVNEPSRGYRNPQSAVQDELGQWTTTLTNEDLMRYEEEFGGG